MQKVENCPLCGKGPMIYTYTYIPFAYECCGVQCYSIENDIAAQMELVEMERHNSLLILEENKQLRSRVARLEEVL